MSSSHFASKISYVRRKQSNASENGRLYEELSLLLFTRRLYELSKDSSKFCNLAIGKEIDIGKYSNAADVVFSYADLDYPKNIILAKIQHKQDDYPINSKVLSTEDAKAQRIRGSEGGLCKHFNLQKYFIHYLSIRDELKITQSIELIKGKIKYFTVFTNVGFNHFELNKKGFRLKEAPADITSLLALRNSSSKVEASQHCYQFGDVSDELLKILKESFDLHRLAKELAKYVVWKNYRENNFMGIDETLIKHYHVALEREVIRKSEQVETQSPVNRMKKAHSCEARFRDDFVDCDITGSKQKLRDALFQAIRELDESKREASDDELKVVLRHAKWKVVPHFGRSEQKTKTDLPSEWMRVKDGDIRDFLKCFVFIVDQPTIAELKVLFIATYAQDDVLRIIMERQGTSLVLPELENATNQKERRAKTFELKRKKTNYKKHWMTIEAISYKVDIQLKMLNVLRLSTQITLAYERENNQYGRFSKLGKLSETLNRFLSSSEKIMCITTTVILFSSIKIMQCLNTELDYRPENGRISVNFDILKCKIMRDSIAESFTSDSIRLLTIECRQVVEEQDMEEFYCKLSKVVRCNPTKKIILIVQKEEYKFLPEKFKNDFQKKQFIVENDSIDLKDFVPMADPLKKEIIVFQEQKQKLSLGRLLAIDSWNSYSEEGFQNDHDIMDGTTLVKILSNDKIEIGSKAITTSNLLGAYTTLFEEVNTEALTNRLLSKGIYEKTGEIYVMSGISGSEKQEKIEKLIECLKLTDHQKEIIEKQSGDIGSNCKIQVADDHFNYENFQQMCRDHPKKRIFWIDVENVERTFKFVLRVFYNPNFYFERQFNILKTFIDKGVKTMLMDDHLTEIFIFSNVEDIKQFMELFDLRDETEKRKIENNYNNSMIKLCTSDYAAEIIFQVLYRENQTVHWLKFEKKQILWCNTRGSVRIIQNYVDQKTNEIVGEDYLINQIRNKKLVVISGAPGSGKTTTVARLYGSNCPPKSLIGEEHWIIWLSLKDHSQTIGNIHTIDTVGVVNFLSKADAKLSDILAKSLLRVALDKNKHFSKPLLLVFDGFDEVSEVNRDKVISLLKFLSNETAAKLCVNTRSQFKETLEKELSTSAIHLNPIDYATALAYIKRYFKECLSLILREQKIHEMSENKIIRKLFESYLYKMKTVSKTNIFPFLETPLQLKFFLETYINHSMHENLNDPNFSYFGMDTYEVLKNIIGRMYDAYFRKRGITGHAQQKEEKYLLNMLCKELAISSIFKLQPKNTLKVLQDKVLSTGIITSRGNDIEFIYTSFRDYFASKVFIFWMKTETNELSSAKKQAYILVEVLKRSDFELIRTFLNCKLKRILNSESNLQEYEKKFKKRIDSKQILQKYGEIVEDLLIKEKSALLDEEGTLLHAAAKEGNTNIAYFLLKSLEKNTDVLRKFLFFTDKNGATALHIACRRENEDIVCLLLNAAKSISDATLQEFLYILNNDHYTALDEVIINSTNIGILNILLDSAHDKVDLILKGSDANESSFCLACLYRNGEFVKYLFGKFKNDEISLKQLLLFPDKRGNALYCAIPDIDTVRSLLSVAKELKDKDEFLKILILPLHSDCLPFQKCIENNFVESAKMLIRAAADIADSKNTLKRLLFGDVEQPLCFPFHVAVKRGNEEICKLLLETAASLGKEVLEKLIFTVNGDDKNAVHLVVESDNEAILSDIFEILEQADYQDIQARVGEMLPSKLDIV